MANSAKLFIATIAFVAFSSVLQAQHTALGGEVIYNIQTSSYGAGLRVELPYKYFSIVPQVAYYPAFNKVTEFYAGASLHLNVIKAKQWTGYGILHGGYNGWINYQNSAVKNAKFSNWDAEAGAGIKLNRCLYPFLECRYNVKWREANLRLGIAYTFGCKSKGGGGSGCPAYGEPLHRRR
ncbi:MAG TPA: hypothetical protein VMW01_15490 [Williamwhitmania sp.]|nr:hypothetical protein [Williamwhitmania sp.]